MLTIAYGEYSDRLETGYLIHYCRFRSGDGLTDIGAIPFDSQYAVGAVSPFDGKIYHSQRSDSTNDSSDDYLCSYDPISGECRIIDDTAYSYNDMEDIIRRAPERSSAFVKIRGTKIGI